MNLQDQYKQALKVFQEFYPGKAPSFESLKITPKQQAYMEKNEGFLVITPPLELYDLITKFDKKQAANTWIYRDLWDQYDFGSELRVSYILTSLKFTNQTYDKQKESLAKEKKSVVGLTGINPRDYVMAQAILRDQSQNLLDKTTFRRFVQLPMKIVDGGSVVGVVDSLGTRLRLDWAYGYAYPNEGVGLSVELDFDASNLELPEVLSSELPDELEINGKVYRAV